MEKTIKVTGKGTIHVVPDVTRLTVDISTVFASYDEAYVNAKENAGWMVKILEYNHLDGKLAKTKRLDISDHYAFALRDVPCSYYSFKGDAYKYYHTPWDNADTYISTFFPALFRAVVEFASTL